MLQNNASQSGAGEAAAPIARSDVDALPAGSIGPETGNAITGAGTLSGAAGADTVAEAPATIVAVRGAGGDASSASGGSLQVDGQYGVLTVDAQGSYSYVRSAGSPDGVQDVFTYTLADGAGEQDTATLTIRIGRDPIEELGQLPLGTEGVVMLPPGVELSDIRVVGRDLVITLPDGSQMVIPGGAVFVPQLVIGDVEVPPANLAALLIDSEPQPAAGMPQSSGGNFAVEVGPLDPGIPLGDLIPPTALAFTPPTFEEAGQFLEEEEPPTVVIVTPDNPAGATSATAEVNEAGLPARGSEPPGSNSGSDGEITSGTIVYTTPDGFESVTVNGIPVVVGTVITTDFGRLTITEINNGPDGSISYTYELLDNTSGDDTADVFTVTVTDADGDTATATLTVSIVDDVPTARADTDSVAAGEFGPVTGNLISDAAAGDAGDSDNGADTVGADGASVTAISGDGGSDSTFNEDGLLEIEGLYGVLTVDSAGNYSYARNADSPGGVTEVFNYTITDGDGDTSSSTLTIDIGDATPSTGQNPTVLLDDDALPGGNPGGVGDDPDAVNLTGTLAGSGGDGALTFNLLVTGAPAGFTYVAGPNGSLLVQQGGVTVLTVTVDSDTGEYSVTQNAPIDHPAGGDENNLSFTINYRVTDADGDTAEGSLAIDVDDDTPVIGRADVSAPTLIVDETDLGTDASADFSSLFTVDFGADGPGTTSFALVVVNGSDSGLVDVATGQPILLFDNDGVIEGRVGGEEGAVAFTVSVSGSGVVTLDQMRALEHPDATDHDDPVSPTGSVIQLSVTATDADGDPVTQTISIGGNLVFEDDGPSITASSTQPTLTVDETVLGTNATASFAAVFTTAFGADGAGSVSYMLGVNAGATGLVDTATGEAVVLVNNGGVIEGRTATSGALVFTVSVDSAGTVTLDQMRAVVHADASDHDDAATLSADDLVTLTGTVTDADGDTASATVNIGQNLVFEDDGPSVSNVAAGSGVTLDETDAGSPAGFPISATSAGAAITAMTAFGADGAGTVTYGLSLTGGVTSLSSGLQTAIGDHPITLVQVDSNTIEGRYEDGGTQVAFTLEMNADGTITVTQNVPLEHLIDGSSAAAHDDALDLSGLVSATVTVTDGDGDTASGSAAVGANIVFEDDGPSIDVTASADAGVVLQTDDADTIGAASDSASSTADFSGVFDLTFDGGADGAAGTPSLSYTLGVSAQGANSGLTQGGSTIYLYVIGGVVVGSTSATQAGVTTANTVFDVSVSATGVVTLTQYSQIDHPIGSDPTASDAPFADHIVSLSDNLVTLTATATITDNDGDTDSDSATVSIGSNLRFTDDGPVATNDSADQTTENAPVTINVVANDAFGADGVSLTTGVTVVSGSLSGTGTLVYNNDGTFTYTPGAGETGTVTFEYQLTDADGDTSTATVTIDLEADSEPQVVDVTATVDDDALAGGNPGGIGDIDANAGEPGATPSEAVYSGQINVDFGGDTGTVSFANLHNTTGTVGTETVLYTWDAGSNTLTATVDSGARAGTALFTVSLSPSGAYTVTLLDNVLHAPGGNENNAIAVLNYRAADSDGDVDTSGTLTITFNDDTPVVSNVAAGSGVMLDETDAGSPAGFPISATSVGAAITAMTAFGADGAAMSGSVSYGLSLAAGGASGLQTAIGDHAITLVQTNATTITGTYEDGGTQTAFTVVINSDGTLTVTQHVPLEHLVDGSSAAAHDDALDLSGLINATVTMTDADGDTASGSAAVGANIVFEDDGPSIDVSASADAGVVLQTDDADTIGAASDSDSSTADFSGVFDLTFDGGADGAAGTPSLSYTLGVSAQGANSGLTQGGSTIYLYVIGGVVVGSTSATQAGVTSANTVFDVSVSATGVVTLTQYSQIDHPIGSDPTATDAPFADHIVSLSDNLVTLTATSTVTDNDGDTDSDSATVSIGSNLQFTDDGPDAQVDGQAALDTLVLDETRPIGTETDGDSDPAGLATITANFADNFATADFGADGPGSTSYSLTLDGSDVPSGLYALDSSDTSASDGDGIGQGDEILLNQSGNTITGSVGGVDYFTITIDPATGQVTFTQLANIWHANTGSDDDTSMLDAAAGSLQVVQTVTDFDGDTDSASIDISSGVFRIEDDGPTADDEPQQDVAEGDSISGQFDFTTGTDGGSITHVNGVELVFGMDGFSQDIAVDDGTIKVKADGSFVFTADASGSGVTSGTFTVTDGDGDTETADWSFNITDANEPTANPSTARLDDDGLPGGNPASTTGDLDANVGEVAPVNSSEAVYHGQLSLSFGGDGTGSINFASMHGTTGMVGVETVEYSWNAATLTLTATVVGGARDGTALFSLTLDDSTSGQYTLTLHDNVLHAAGGDENDATAALTFTVLDSDGSSDSSTLTITFDDDAPTLDVTEGSDSGVVLQTDDADTQGAAEDTASSAANFSGVFGLTFAAGADGAAATPTLSYTLGVSADGADSGLTQGGSTIYLYEIGGVVVGSTSSTEGGVNAGNTVFDVSVSATGVVTLTQYSQIDHPIADDPTATDAPFADQFVSIADNLITLTASATITDNDGDTATDSEVASIGSNLRFTDDGPVAVNDSANQATENAVVTINVVANDSEGADGVNLTTGITLVPGTLTGSGTLTYNGDGTFTYEPAANEEGTVTFDYEITDFDGDTSTATVTINLQDDSDPAPVNATAMVDDEGLANGITGGDGDLVVPDNDGDGDESTFEGTLTANFGGDSPGTFSFADMDGDTDTVGTETVAYSWDGTSNTLTATITSGDRTGTDLFQVTVTPSTGVYTLTLLTNVLHTYDGTNTENDATAALTFTATDSEGESANGTLTVTFDDDMPVAFDPDPITTGLENEAGSSATADLDVDGDVDGNIGADLPGLITFANIVNGQDSGETSDGDPIEYWLSNDGQTLQGRTNSTDGTNGTLIFQIDLNQDHDPAGDDTYTVTMHGRIDNGAGFSFDNLSSTSAGNSLYRGVGTNDPATTVDLLLSASAGGAPATVNTDNDSIGAANQSMDSGESVRIDFVTNLTSGASTPTGFGYDDHVSSNSFLGEIPQVQGNQAQTASFTVYALDTTLTQGGEPDRTPDDGFDDATITQITDVIVVDWKSGETTTLDISSEPTKVWIEVAYGIDVMKNTDGSVTFRGVQEGDSYGFRTDGGDFNAVAVQAHSSFDLGVFSIGTVDTGDPINLLFDLALTDADGDTVVVEDALDITIEPASTTGTSTASTTMLSQEPITDSSSKLLANDNVEQQLKTMNAANMNTVFLGAVAAAGLAATPAAAARPEFLALNIEDMADVSALGTLTAAAAVEEGSRSMLGNEMKSAVGDDSLAHSGHGHDSPAAASNSLSGSENNAQSQAPSQLSQGTDSAQTQVSEMVPVADTVAMPSAEALAAAFGGTVEGDAKVTGEVGRVLADALSGGENGQSIDAMLDALPAAGSGPGAAAEALASQGGDGVSAWDTGALAHFSSANSPYTLESMAAHVDAAPAV